MSILAVRQRKRYRNSGRTIRYETMDDFINQETIISNNCLRMARRRKSYAGSGRKYTLSRIGKRPLAYIRSSIEASLIGLSNQSNKALSTFCLRTGHQAATFFFCFSDDKDYPSHIKKQSKPVVVHSTHHYDLNLRLLSSNIVEDKDLILFVRIDYCYKLPED
jgi:hypothetical protein